MYARKPNMVKVACKQCIHPYRNRVIKFVVFCFFWIFRFLFVARIIQCHVQISMIIVTKPTYAANFAPCIRRIGMWISGRKNSTNNMDSAATNQFSLSPCAMPADIVQLKTNRPTAKYFDVKTFKWPYKSKWKSNWTVQLNFLFEMANRTIVIIAYQRKKLSSFTSAFYFSLPLQTSSFSRRAQPNRRNFLSISISVLSMTAAYIVCAFAYQLRWNKIIWQ